MEKMFVTCGNCKKEGDLEVEDHRNGMYGTFEKSCYCDKCETFAWYDYEGKVVED